MQAGFNNVFDCIKLFPETDQTEYLKRCNVPIGAAAVLSSKIVKDATLEVCPGAPNGLTDPHKDHVKADLLAFLKS